MGDNQRESAYLVEAVSDALALIGGLCGLELIKADLASHAAKHGIVTGRLGAVATSVAKVMAVTTALPSGGHSTESAADSAGEPATTSGTTAVISRLVARIRAGDPAARTH
jgi:hypothetical protein